jgi:hypothetical protein
LPFEVRLSGRLTPTDESRRHGCATLRCIHTCHFITKLGFRLFVVPRWGFYRFSGPGPTSTLVWDRFIGLGEAHFGFQSTASLGLGPSRLASIAPHDLVLDKPLGFQQHRFDRFIGLGPTSTLVFDRLASENREDGRWLLA